MAISADPDQLASLFAKAGHIRVQQDKGYTSAGRKMDINP